MESTQAAANSSISSDPGSFSVETPLYLDKNVVDDSDVLKINNGTDSIGSSINSVSDDGGFVSGEEDFEVGLEKEKPILAYPNNKLVEIKTVAKNSGDPLVGSPEFLTPIANDVADKSYKDVVLEGGEGEEKIVVGGEGFSGEKSNELVNENFLFSKKSYKDVVEEGGEGEEGEEKIVVGGEGLSGENSIELLNENVDVAEKSYKDVVVEGGEGEEKVVIGGEGVTGENSSELVNENVDVVAMMECFREDKVTDFSEIGEELSSGVEEIKVKGEEEVEEEKIEVLNSANSVGEVVEKHIVESGDSEEVSAQTVKSVDGVEVTHEGDTVVETVNVELLAPGVAVVGETEENETATGNLGLNNESDQVSTGNVEEVSIQNNIALTSSEIVRPDGLKFTPEGDSVVEDIHLKSGVAVVGEEREDGDGIESSGNGSHQVHGEIVNETAVQDSIFEDPDANVVDSTKSKVGIITTPEGDSVVENIQVDVSEPGVAVVSKLEENGQANGHAVIGATDPVTSTLISGEERKLSDDTDAIVQDEIIENGVSVESFPHDTAKTSSLQNKELEDETKVGENEATDEEVSGSDVDSEGVAFRSSEAAKQFIEELEQGSEGGSNSGAESQDYAERVDGQIVTDSEEEGTDEEGENKELFDSAALAALLKAATGAGSEGGNITITSQDGSRLFTVERPAGLGSSMQSLRPAPRANRSNFLTPSSFATEESEDNLSEDEKKKLEKLQSIRVKFLRLVKRLGLSSDESVAAQVLYRLALVAGRQTGQLFGLDTAKQTALQLEEDGKEDMDFSVNILVLGKSGVGKSATINAIFGEEKARIDAFQAATTTVKEITGIVDGVKLRVFDTPGLKSSVVEQSFNRSILASVKKLTKKNPVDIVLYVDRLDAQTRDLNDIPLLRTITGSLGSSIWRSVIVTLTHAASAPPEGPSGSPLSYDIFVSQRSHVLQQSIGQAVGDIRMMSPSLMNPVCLVENHLSCRKNREGQKVLPNGQSWRPQLMILCYSMKILSEANSLSKPQDAFDHRKLFGFRSRSPPLPYMLSSMLQSRAHPKLSTEQGGDNGDSDVDLADLSDSDQEDEDEYDQLPPFKPLKKSQLAKLSNEQRKAYFEEYDYRVKLLQKKQWREELKRMKEMKKKGKDAAPEYGYTDEDPDAGSAAPVSVPLPDMALPPSFDGDNPAHRYRFLEPTSQFLARPVLDTHGWDHDCGYDGVNLEQSLAIASQFPAVISVQVTKDKKEFSINMDSSVAAKHGENGSTMAGFDIQNMGKQLAYIVRGETKFKILKKNKTAAGISVTFLGENVVTGLKIEDQVSFGKQYSLVASAGTVRSQQDVAYGANIEMQRRELDYPIGQVQSSFGMSIIKWRGDLALGFNSLAQFSVGRNSKVAVRAGINNKLSGQISVRTSSSDHLSLALASIIPTAISIYKKLYPAVGEKYSIY